MIIVNVFDNFTKNRNFIRWYFFRTKIVNNFLFPVKNAVYKYDGL